MPQAASGASCSVYLPAPVCVSAKALNLRWQQVDLGTGTLYVVEAKTYKGVREVHMSPALREELTLWRADCGHADPDDFVIHTSTGGKQNPSNLRRDVLNPAVKTANAKLAQLGIAPISGLTFHSLRRTYASLRCACGDDIRYTADQIGHEDPRFTLKVYARATKRRDRLAKPQRKAYDRAIEWARLDGITAEADVTLDPLRGVHRREALDDEPKTVEARRPSMRSSRWKTTPTRSPCSRGS
jgi:integrase